MFFLKFLGEKLSKRRVIWNPVSPRDHRDQQDRLGFFIEPSECITCGCCEAEAPQNFGSLSPSLVVKTGEIDANPPSCVKKQPQTREELTATVKAAANCMVGCIYYGGDDPEVFRQWLKHWDDQDANGKNNLRKRKRMVIPWF